jgi:pyridoxine kinase
VLEPQTDFLNRAWLHLKTLNLKFAAVAFGLVGERSQFPLLEEIAASVKAAGGLVLVDPILGDNGRRYGLFHEDYVPAFRSLVGYADVTTPNLTEAALLLGEDPSRVPDSPQEVGRWTRALAALGPTKVVLTSAPFAQWPQKTGVAWFDRSKDSSGTVVHPRLGHGIPGTGDALAARLLSSLLRGKDFPSSVKRAVRGTLRDLRRSRAAGRPALWGPEGPLEP